MVWWSPLWRSFEKQVQHVVAAWKWKHKTSDSFQISPSLICRHEQVMNNWPTWRAQWVKCNWGKSPQMNINTAYYAKAQSHKVTHAARSDTCFSKTNGDKTMHRGSKSKKSSRTPNSNPLFWHKTTRDTDCIRCADTSKPRKEPNKHENTMKLRSQNTKGQAQQLRASGRM